MKYRNNLLYKLTEYGKNGLTPFHMPGHKRAKDMIPDVNAYGIDITEIDGFDDLNHPDGIFKESMERAARIFGSEKTYFLVNGATSGILASVTALCHNGENMILAANSHKSAFNAAFINKIDPIYVFPDENEVIHVEDVEKAFADNKNRSIACVFITSPTYTGVVSDIKSIADVVHQYGAILIVDEAHGAHMTFNDIFPESAIKQDADIVIHGIHKTLPSLTQTALLHIARKDRVNVEEMGRMVSIFNSSSPSYILSGAIDYCMDYLETDGKEDFGKYAGTIKKLYDRLEGLRNLSILPYTKNRDASKIVVGTANTGISGRELYDYFRTECNIQPEMSQPDYVILMTSVWDSDETLENLAEAILYADNNVDLIAKQTTIFDAQEYLGKTAEHMIYAYPPGVPIVRPGEMINEEKAEKIDKLLSDGYKVYGLDD